MGSYLRGVVEEPRYTQDLDDLRQLYPALDDIQTDLSWELSHHPTAGTPLKIAPDFRLYKTAPSIDTPAFHVLYTFDQANVILHSITVAEGG